MNDILLKLGGYTDNQAGYYYDLKQKIAEWSKTYMDEIIRRSSLPESERRSLVSYEIKKQYGNLENLLNIHFYRTKS